MLNRKEKEYVELNFKEKNILISFVLWFFLGMIGAHRFYFGETTKGIIMLMAFIVSINTANILYFLFILFWMNDSYYVYKKTFDYNERMINFQIDYLKSQERNDKNKTL